MSLVITEKLIQRQINNWNRFREFLKDEPQNDQAQRGPVITVSRLSGSGGRTLATGLAERLGITLHDQSLVDKIAKDRKLEAKVVSQLDETAINQAALWITGVLNRRIFMKDEYHTALVRVVTNLAIGGNVILLGRGANFILAENATLRIRVVASWANRLARVMARTGLSRAEARALLQETDRNRREFIRKVFKVRPNAPENFDLVLNSDRMTPECMLETATVALIGTPTTGPARMPSQV